MITSEEWIVTENKNKKRKKTNKQKNLNPLTNAENEMK